MAEAEHIKKETGSREVEIPSPPKPLAEWTKNQNHAHRHRVHMMNTFPLSSPTKISVPFVSLEVNGVTCKFLGDSGASVNIVSNDLSKMFDSVLKPCDT